MVGGKENVSMASSVVARSIGRGGVGVVWRPAVIVERSSGVTH